MRARCLLSLLVLTACAETQGSRWMATPLPDDPPPGAGPTRGARPRAREEVGPPTTPIDSARAVDAGPRRVLGTFRNTYYDFPRATDHEGPPTPVFSADCREIARVPRGFHDAVCVQGSGRLASGATISFAKRDCPCAEVCPRSGQKICFEALDPARFPSGRGALGTAITPLRTVAVDPSVVPLGTRLFLPELVGMPTSEDGAGSHDGCVIAEDRGSRVKGQHLDLFTGSEAMTRLLNRRLPSNQGLTVIAGEPRCAVAR
ncbi:MAG: hypothetical protein IT374_20220 [Polyangiaceae bacterium]|nr:hypothetical protein [Polyangiaceae bacterium]